ncbi:hypothetical protein QE152_g22055 [Popillia japonica]|uniref:Double jelly roll-like domain-containing protein n=1 Tax=Popillia japonica TaxID=7064 RepID=A0AAW1KLK9_POPJA
MDILDVQRKVRLDNSITEMEFHNHITEMEFHNHVPFGSPKYGNNDEIRIVIPEIDRYTLPSESELVIEGKLRFASDESKNSVTASLIHNAGAFMFSHIRYIISGVEVGEVRNVGITSTMKGYFSYSPSYVNKLENCGWDVSPSYVNKLENCGWDVGTGKALIIDSKGNFNICVPLKMLMGFAEYFKQVVMNVLQELVLKRCADDNKLL